MEVLVQKGGGERGLGVKTFFSYPNELLIWGYTENLVDIRHMVYEVVKGGGLGGIGFFWGKWGWGGKKFLPTS